MLKRFLIAVAAMMAMFCVGARAEAVPRVFLGGEEIAFSAEDGFGQPYIDENNRIQVPVRKLAQALSAEVEYTSEPQQVILRKDFIEAVIPIGEKYYTVNGKTVEIDTAAQIIDDRTYLPARFTAESLACTVEWDGESLSALISPRQSPLTVSEWDEVGMLGATSPFSPSSFGINFNGSDVSTDYEGRMIMCSDSTLSLADNHFVKCVICLENPNLRTDDPESLRITELKPFTMKLEVREIKRDDDGHELEERVIAAADSPVNITDEFPMNSCSAISVVWDLTDAWGNKITPGEYEIHAFADEPVYVKYVGEDDFIDATAVERAHFDNLARLTVFESKSETDEE